MSVGSSYSTAKAAIVDKLSSRPGLAEVSVLDRTPEQPNDAVGPSGLADVIYLHEATGDYDNVVSCGLPLMLDERYDLTLVIESARADSDGTQATVDLRVDEMLYEVLAELASDPTFGVTQFTAFRISRGSFRRAAGQMLSKPGHAAMCALELEVKSRITFT